MSKKANKPKKATFVSFLLDETGSMQSIKDDTVGGFNAYVETLQKDGADIIFSLVSFNSSVTQKRYVGEPIDKIEPLTDANYQPRAMTPLIDASVKIIKATDEAVQKRDDDPNVVIVMQTDGQENVSVEYTTADLAALIKEKEAAGWQFVFLGAGLDASTATASARSKACSTSSCARSYAKNGPASTAPPSSRAPRRSRILPIPFLSSSAAIRSGPTS